MPEQWYESALDIYRRGWLIIEPFRGDPREDIQFYIEEMKEALLDLKQATIAGDADGAARYMQEVLLIAAQFGRKADEP